MSVFRDEKILQRRYNLKAVIPNRGFRALLLYRIADYLLRKRIPIPPLILTRIIQIIYGINTDYRANTEGGVLIVHGTGTVIGFGVKIKKECIIYHRVTLGIKMLGHNNSFPEIGKNVILGAGCKVLGKIRDDSIIGANMVITFNVPENHLVKFSHTNYIEGLIL